ncbi:POTRA domain-containing protein [Aquimarina sp. 2201CG5-10]|uniref:POTRA domain-containing protein n=1 Tax=Aquimarina callyspongiae TaxID=3098150 RepID=UPI002AB47C0A|nr:BamA/TamA family outer membrane protein [Aquimarina sp. 2201CG5-10]MDY8134428.1 POTRA domain-containing protein [Aquimarina sp. 2201CG5-10]
MKASLFFLFVLNTCIHSLCYAQNPILTLSAKGKDSVETSIIDSTSYQTRFENYLSLKKEIDTLQKKLLKAGYLDLKLASLQKTNDSTLSANFNLGVKYKNLSITYNNQLIPKRIVQKISNNATETTFNTPFDKTEKILQYLTDYLVNQGNTFSHLSLSQIKKKGDTIYATLNSQKSKSRIIDNIIIRGYEKFPKSYLKYYSRLKKGATFNKDKLIEQSQNIDNLGFATNIKPPEVLFRKDSTNVFLYLKKQTANNFDGFLGFSSDTEDGNLELNGYINLNLVNNLNFGERLNLIYKSDGNEQQRFEADITLPYILKTPLGIEAGLEIFKRDSSFLITQQNVNLNYLINDKSNVFLGYKTINSSNLLDIPQPALNINDYDASFIRSGYERTRRQNNQLFPIKSRYAILLELGSRKTDIATTDQIKGELQLGYTFELNPRNSILIKDNAAAIFSDDLFTNELYRFGGINSIRGFEENTINASLYNVLNTEYRYLLSQNLLIHSIIDYAYFEDESNNLSDNLTSFGFGLGLNTATGLFRIIFANGKTSDQNFRFSNTKVHISLNARF